MQVLAGEFLSSAGSGATFPYLVVYLRDICGLSGGQVAVVLVARSLAAIAGSVGGGALSDRHGAARTVVALAAVAATAAAVMAGSHGNAMWPGVVGAMLCTGAEAARVPALDALLAHSVPEDARRTVFSWHNTVVTLGALLGVAAASGALGVLGIPAGLRCVYAVDAASFVVLALLALLVHRVGRRQGTPSGTAAGRGARHHDDLEHDGAVRAPGYAAVAQDPAMRRAFVFVLLVVAAGFAQLQIGLPALTLVTGQVDVLGWLFAANMLIVVVLQMPAQRALQRLPRRVVLAGGAACMAGAWALVAVSPAPGPGTLAAAAVVFACGEVAHMPVITALVNDLAPPGLAGRYNGAHTLAWTSGFAVGALATGTLLDARSIQPFFAASAAVLGLAALTALGLDRIRSRESNG
ncbi:MFS transporter [Streptomyces sp. NPDC004065]|uniref:MFS transporter n=1 Tax=Streptomyces sp. NPDC004065 TaxID=3364689 RepID=UPI003850DAF5